MKTSEAAQGKWHGILVALGVDPKYLVDKHGPCPICAGKDRFRWDDLGGDGTYYCSQCGAGDGFALLCKIYGWGWPKAASEVDLVVNNVEKFKGKTEQTEAQKKAAIKRVLDQSSRVTKGDPVWRYLSRRCGDVSIEALADLRYHPSMPHPDGGDHHCMLAIMRHADHTGASVHRTFLTRDGYKATVEPVRMIMPGCVKGAAVRLGHNKNIHGVLNPEVGLAEGIETALCARSLHGGVVWAAISAGGMTAWEPPVGLTKVVVYGDNDLSFTGQAAAYSTARRLRQLGLGVEVRIPEQAGWDWADVRMDLVGVVE
jgi:putative DNA primase/helicase